jgi:cytochrome P450
LFAMPQSGFARSAPGWTAENVNLVDPTILMDPYPYFAWLRTEAPVAYDPQHRTWVVSRFRDVQTVIRDNETFSANAGRIAALEGEDRSAPLMITTDPPEHTRLRRLVNRPFTPRGISQWSERIQAITDELIDTILSKGDAFDVVRDLAYPLPTMVIAEILGVPPEDRDLFKTWSDLFVEFTNKRADWQEAIQPVLIEFRDYFGRVIADRRLHPADDMISTLVAISDEDGSRLSEAEMMNMLFLFLIAGNETTTNLIGSAVGAALTHHQYAQAHRDPILVRNWIEETLRWDAPVQTDFRRVTREVELSGQHISQGDLVLVLFASANRDEVLLKDGEDFDLRRQPSDHLGFGFGIHFCLGSSLARMEASTALQALLSRVGVLELDPDRPWVRNPVLNVRGYASLPVRVVGDSST